jgi:hypothetical protein
MSCLLLDSIVSMMREASTTHDHCLSSERACGAVTSCSGRDQRPHSGQVRQRLVVQGQHRPQQLGGSSRVLQDNAHEDTSCTSLYELEVNTCSML